MTHAQVDSYWMPLAQIFIAQGSGGFLVHNVPLWFVTCLFVMEVIYYFLSGFKKVWILIVSIAMASVSYYMITYVDVVDITLLPWNLEVLAFFRDRTSDSAEIRTLADAELGGLPSCRCTYFVHVAWFSCVYWK